MHGQTPALGGPPRRTPPAPRSREPRGAEADVPEYLSATNLAALRRMFERDKVELREFGIPIVTVSDSAGEVVGYQLRRDAFYLPYLTLMQGAARKSSPPARRSLRLSSASRARLRGG